MNRTHISTRWFSILSGVSGIVGVAMLTVSFNINPGPPPYASSAELIRFAENHAGGILWGAWLQALGPVFIVLFAFALVRLAGAMQRVSGWMTMFGAMTLMTVSLIEITFYIGTMYEDPAVLPSVSLRFIYAVQHLFFVVAAPALFFPLGFVLVSSRILPRIFGYLALVLAGVFGIVGVYSLPLLRLPDGVTALGAIQPFWWLAASITLIVRSGRIADNGALESSR
jgi:hypothetical protein